MSFVPENFREFFGDWQCEGSHYNPSDNSHSGCVYTSYYDNHPPTWHWGFRHWIWMIMGVTLFIYNVVLIIIKIDKYNTND
jgi:hypothetical protein